MSGKTAPVRSLDEILAVKYAGNIIRGVSVFRVQLSLTIIAIAACPACPCGSGNQQLFWGSGLCSLWLSVLFFFK